MSDWKKKTLWVRRGTNFAVEVSLHTDSSLDPMDGENRWCVYAYIYPEHPHFAAFSGDPCFRTLRIACRCTVVAATCIGT
jgi:hypothetical protein